MRQDFENKMKLAQTTLSRRDSLKIARRFNAGNGSPCTSSPAGARASARFNVHLPATQEMSAPLSVRTLKRRERRAPRTSIAPASWTAPAPWRFSRGGRKAAEGCRSPKPRGVSGVSLTPWLQPGVSRNARIENRFNGLSARGEAVETAGIFPARSVHRAEATVLMRTEN